MRKFVEQAMNGKLTETQTEELLYQATFFLAQIASQKMQAALKVSSEIDYQNTTYFLLTIISMYTKCLLKIHL